MTSQIKTAPFTLMSSLLFLACSAHVHADTWKLDDFISQNIEQSTPYFFYVAKGESWQNVLFNSQFNVQGNSTVIVRYDNQLIHQ